MPEHLPGEALDQLIGGTFHMDWNLDYDDAYTAVEESWFASTGPRPDVHEPVIADIDLLFEETSSPEERRAQWPNTGIRLEQIDDLLRAIRARAVRALEGDATPMRPPWADDDED